MDLDVKSVETWLKFLREFLKLYDWLANSFVLDHFVKSHWQTLPLGWQEFLCQLSPPEFSHWIVTGRTKIQRASGHAAPLSLQCLRRCTEVLSVRREFLQRSTVDSVMEDKLLKLLSRHVKPKKQHEVKEMSHLIQELSERSGGVKNLVDIGSGLGHLCRFLSYGLGFNTVGIDSDSKLGGNARAFNEEIEKNLRKGGFSSHLINQSSPGNSKIRSEHLNMYLEVGQKICHDQEFGLVGLHGCGDLGGLIVQNFVQNPQVKFLAFASCCYMKLKDGYPLSRFLRGNILELKYEALELSCHAKEIYVERLKDPAQVDKLKTHCYRASLEVILVDHGLIKEGLRPVKNNFLMDFNDYAKKATAKLNIDLTEDLERRAAEIDSMLTEWMKVVYFYTLRVMIAPVIETVVLLDRALLILESGYKCQLRPIFDPVKSPRNIVLVGLK